MSAATERIDIRVTPEDKALFLEAARLSHESVPEFVVRTAREAALKVVKREQITRVPAVSSDPMAASLEDMEDTADSAVINARAEEKTVPFRSEDYE